MIKFKKHSVVNTENNVSAKVRYSLDNRIDQRKCVTLYSNECSFALRKILPNDYNQKDDLPKINLFEDHPLYAEARVVAEKALQRNNF